MISACVFRKRVLIYQGGRSLMMQMAEWVSCHPEYALLRVPGGSDAQLGSIMDIDTPLIADATQSAEEVLKFVQSLDPDLTRACVSVYTESAHYDLERAVRSIGIPYVDGPLEMADWDRILLGRSRLDTGNSNGVEGSVLLVWRAHERYRHLLCV